MTEVDPSKYFAKRAPRYQKALRGCPNARMLDVIPYIIAIHQLDIRGRSIYACDAFGGTGFFADWLASKTRRFTVVDCCQAMFAPLDLTSVEFVLTSDNFHTFSNLHQGKFDIVLSHGGLHHAIVCKKGIPDHQASRSNQAEIVTRLGKLLAPGGILIVADIPTHPPAEIIGSVASWSLDDKILSEFINEKELKWLSELVGPLESHSLDSFRKQVEERHWTQVDFEVPRHFFDTFVSNRTPMGHVAVYPDFDQLDLELKLTGLECLGRINYRGPWLFDSSLDAGWFFKEKFSVGTTSERSAAGEEAAIMWHTVTDQLGTKTSLGSASVNWGVTYAFYTR